MADLAITVGVRFSDGSIAYLNNAAVTAGVAGEEILTANAGGDLSQTSGIQIGQAYANLQATHAFAICQEVGAVTGVLLHAYFVGPNGAIMVPIQGGRTGYAQMQPLYRPIRMEPGVTVFGAAQSTSDSATLIASASLCSPQKCDVFAVTAVDGANTELVSLQSGATLGQSLNNCTVDMFFGTYAGFFAGFGPAMKSLTLPAIALALPQASILARVMRSSLLDTLGEDYIRTARAKGLSRRQALWRHALRNALIPVLTIIGLQFSFLMAGAIIIENVFFLPGLEKGR
jgi:hypothetical protein